METTLVARRVEWNDTVRDKRHRHTVARSATSRSSASACDGWSATRASKRSSLRRPGGDVLAVQGEPDHRCADFAESVRPESDRRSRRALRRWDRDPLVRVGATYAAVDLEPKRLGSASLARPDDLRGHLRVDTPGQPVRNVPLEPAVEEEPVTACRRCDQRRIVDDRGGRRAGRHALQHLEADRNGEPSRPRGQAHLVPTERPAPRHVASRNMHPAICGPLLEEAQRRSDGAHRHRSNLREPRLRQQGKKR